MADDVVACSYRLCAVCGQLFHDSYTRSNKPDGSKVLKCFPHCCPEHSRRRSCGTHLELYVHSDSADICVFARFEATLSTTTLTLGDAVPFLAGNIRTKEHARGEWIACHRDTSETTTMPVVYIVNRNALEAEWAYGWTGSARVVDRQSTHHLVTYVFRCNLSTRRLVVIGVARSPPFIITSARRASAVASVVWDEIEAFSDLSPTSGLTRFDFVPCNCGTQDLFTSTYYRCFPHCCPSHAPHSMCGGTLRVCATLDTSAPVHQYRVYGRFEMLLTTPLALVSELRLDALDPDWREAELEPSPICFATTAHFVFNQVAETRTRKMHRWAYGWKGSASLSARATRHVFRAYVIAVHQAETSVGVDTIAVVVGMAQSHSFQIESHRSKKAAT